MLSGPPLHPPFGGLGGESRAARFVRGTQPPQGVECALRLQAACWGARGPGARLAKRALHAWRGTDPTVQHGRRSRERAAHRLCTGRRAPESQPGAALAALFACKRRDWRSTGTETAHPSGTSRRAAPTQPGAARARRSPARAVTGGPKARSGARPLARRVRCPPPRPRSRPRRTRRLRRRAARRVRVSRPSHRARVFVVRAAPDASRCGSP